MNELTKPLNTIDAEHQNVINSDNTVISYSSDGKPLSHYKDDIWLIINEDVKLNFGNLSDGFKSVCKRLIFKLLNGDDLISKKSIGMKNAAYNI